MSGNRRNGPNGIIAALLLGMAIAFPAGMFVAGRGAETATAPRPRLPASEMRNPYSPRISSDPAFLDQQRRGIEALEAHCRRSGENCTEARQARRWLEQQAGR